MATFNQRDVQSLVIGAQATATTGAIATLADGEIGIFTPAGTRMTEALAATETRFIIAKGRAGTTAEPVLISGPAAKANVITANAKLTMFAAKSEQVDVLGYDGTSGSIQAINNNLYHIRVNLNQSITSNIGGLYVKHGIYESDATAAQWEIAQGLTESLINDFSKETDIQLKPTRLCDEAGTALTGTGDITVTNGSKYIQAATDIDAVLVVGDFIRLGAGITTSFPVYQVVAIDTATEVATLDVPYQGASDVLLTATETISIANAAGIAAEWGITLTGQSLPYSVGKINYAVAGWVTTLENMGTTALTSTGATPGTGNTNQIKDLEWFVQGNEGDYFRMGEPNLYAIRAETVDGINYNMIDLSTEEIYTGSIVAGPIRKTFTLAIPTTTPNYALTATANDITDVLEVLVFGSVNGNFNLG